MLGASKTGAAVELTGELRALMASDNSLGEPDEKKVRGVVGEMVESFEKLRSIETNPFADVSQPYYSSSAIYHKSKYLQDKRCVLAYLLWRQKQITNSWWTAQDNTVKPNLSAAESSFLLDYNNLMVEYMTSFAVPLDLRAFLWRPPTVQQLEVRGLVNHVFVSPVTGHTISIYSGKQVLLNFEDAESLLQQNVVKLV